MTTFIIAFLFVGAGVIVWYLFSTPGASGSTTTTRPIATDNPLLYNTTFYGKPTGAIVRDQLVSQSLFAQKVGLA